MDAEGSELARSISQQGHAVTIVDAMPTTSTGLARISWAAPCKASASTAGRWNGQASPTADAFAATTQSDNENIVAAKIARDVFKVPRVAARVYNPGRREVYERLGFQTVMSIQWGARRLEQMLLHPGVIDMEQIGHGDVRLLRVRVPDAWHGQTVTSILDGNAVICAIERGGHAFVPRPDERLQPEDIVFLSIPTRLMPEVLAIAPAATREPRPSYLDSATLGGKQFAAAQR